MSRQFEFKFYEKLINSFSAIFGRLITLFSLIICYSLYMDYGVLEIYVDVGKNQFVLVVVVVMAAIEVDALTHPIRLKILKWEHVHVGIDVSCSTMI